MLDRLLTNEEIDTLKLSIKQLKEQRASLIDDLEHGLPVQPHIDAIDGGIRSAEHMLSKYGKPAAIRPKRK